MPTRQYFIICPIQAAFVYPSNASLRMMSLDVLHSRLCLHCNCRDYLLTCIISGRNNENVDNFNFNLLRNSLLVRLQCATEIKKRFNQIPPRTELRCSSFCLLMRLSAFMCVRENCVINIGFLLSSWGFAYNAVSRSAAAEEVQWTSRISIRTYTHREEKGFMHTF